MLLALIAAPSSIVRFRRAWHQPLGKAAIVFLMVLLLAATWSTAPFPVALKAWLGWRQFLLLFVALAIFDTRASKLAFAAIFVVATSAATVASFLAFDFGAAQATSDVAGGIVLRNHVTQGMALTAGALLALVLVAHARRGSWQQWACGAAALLMVANVVFITYARSAYLALAVTSLVATLGIAQHRARIAAVSALIVLMCGAIWLSPLISQRFERALQEIQETNSSDVITSMGIRPVMWETTASIARDAPLIGHGLGSFPEQYRSAVTQRYTGWKATLTADPHNQYLLILAETGLLGLSAFAWFLFSAPRQQVRGSFGVIGIALLLAWSLTSLFSSHFHTFNEGHLIAILLGVCLAREVGIQSHALNAASTAERTSA
jgi:O-antigen ligase